MIWSEFIGAHEGQTAYVVGLGESWGAYQDGMPGTTYGVNDCGRNFTPDYLVCIDNWFRFSSERWKHIKFSEARNIFSNHDWKELPVARRDALVRIALSSEKGSVLRDKFHIDTSFTSVFVAANIALLMGHTTIAICGSDFTNHHLDRQLGTILRHFKEFRNNAERIGVYVVSIVEDSPLNTVLDYTNLKHQ